MTGHWASPESGGVCGCNSITHTGSDHELSRQSIYESISYHDTILGRRRMGRGGVAFAVQPHREVRPESGLVGIVKHIVVTKADGTAL